MDKGDLLEMIDLSPIKDFGDRSPIKDFGPAPDGTNRGDREVFEIDLSKEEPRHRPHGPYCGCPPGVYVGLGCPNPEFPLEIKSLCATQPSSGGRSS